MPKVKRHRGIRIPVMRSFIALRVGIFDEEQKKDATPQAIPKQCIWIHGVVSNVTYEEDSVDIFAYYWYDGKICSRQDTLPFCHYGFAPPYTWYIIERDETSAKPPQIHESLIKENGSICDFNDEIDAMTTPIAPFIRKEDIPSGQPCELCNSHIQGCKTHMCPSCQEYYHIQCVSKVLKIDVRSVNMNALEDSERTFVENGKGPIYLIKAIRDVKKELGIFDTKSRGKEKTRYLVEWAGYGPETSWVKEDVFKGRETWFKELLDKYERSKDKREGKPWQWFCHNCKKQQKYYNKDEDSDNEFRCP